MATGYFLNMKSLPEKNAKWMPYIFAQSMTTNSYSAMPPDMWIECTMNKGSKLKSGWKRLLRSEKGLLVHMKCFEEYIFHAEISTFS